MKRNIFSIALLITVLTALLSFDIPKGWVATGDHPGHYDMGIDPGSGRNGKNAATIRSTVKKTRGYAVLMQSCLPGKYLGKRIRMTGYMRSEKVTGLAFFWLRADRTKANDDKGDDKDEPVHMGGGGAYRSVAIGMSIDENFPDRIKGTMGWRRYDVVIEVPKFASNLAYGAYLGGTGQIWFDGISFEEVNKDVPLSAPERLNEPGNLDFDE